MFLKNFVFIFLLYWNFFFLQTENKRYLNEHKFLYLKPKQVSCDDIDINESDHNLPENVLIGNLSSCLWQKLNEYDFNSFSTQLNDQSIQALFDKYFILDDKTGLIYQRQNIDREKICLDKKFDSQGNKINEVVFGAENSSLMTDHFDCDCQSNLCRISLIFVAFKKTINSDSRIKKNKFRNFNKFSLSNNHIHKYLSLSININDINDNRPYFKKNFLYLEITEQFGQNLALDVPVPSDNLLCNVLVSNFDIEIANNQQIQLEKPFDPDSSLNSEFIYKLVLLSNQEMDYVKKLEVDFEQNENFFQSKLANLIEKFKDNCLNRFELIENNLNQELYVKINTFLDREQQSVYNFILLVLEKNYPTERELNGKNFLLFRLKINDLNDNRPKFDQTKYTFYLNEVTDYQVYYEESMLDYSGSIYFGFLQQICTNLENRIKVEAHDLDEGVNAQIKYKIIQQINRKNLNTKFLDNSMMSEFIIDKNGSIKLELCEKLDNLRDLSRESFLDLTKILDYEVFHKHVIVVEATDSNTENPLSSVVTVDINLTDLNDNKPLIVNLYSRNCVYQKGLDLNISVQELSSQEFSSKIVINGLSEFSPKGSCIGQFIVKDLDTENTNRQINSKVLDQSSDHSLFLFRNLKNQNSTNFQSIQTNEIFEMYLNFEPDAELQTVYNLVIELSDSGQVLQLKSRTEFMVIIKDENDNDPKFDKDLHVFYIDEWNEFESNNFNSLAYCFTRLEAHDSDITTQNKLINYSLQAIQPKIKLKVSNKIRRNKEEENFYIDQSTGYLCVKDRSLLDREKRSKYDFVVRANNQNSTRYAQTLVQIVINDLNDNPPQFKRKDYRFYITEKYSNLVTSMVLLDSKAHENLDKTFVGNVKAFDKDSLNSEIFYFVDNNDMNSIIQVNTKNPSNPFLREKDLIVVNDTSFTQEQIYPTDNTFTYDSLIDNFINNQTIFYHVKAIKHDDTKSKLLNKKVYKLVNNLEEIIYVDAYSGDIFLLNNFIDREKVLSIKFKVFAKDKQQLSDISLKSWTNVTIEIDDINDSVPICYSKSNFLTEINKTLEILAIYFDFYKLELNQNYKMALIYEFNCIDLDSTKKNCDLKYEIEEFDLKSLDSKIELDHYLVKKFQNFMKFFRIFKLDRSTGKLYVDLGSYWWRNDLEKFLSYVNNCFLIIKFKISDDGIVPLSNYYQLELLICANGSEKYDQHCSFNGVENLKPVLTKRLHEFHYENLISEKILISTTLPSTVTHLRQNFIKQELKNELLFGSFDLKTIIPRTTFESKLPSANKVDLKSKSNSRFKFSIVNIIIVNFIILFE